MTVTSIKQASLLPQVRSSGPTDASIMIVGEAPGETEVDRGIPFVGLSGIELTSMLSEAGIDRDLCFITNVARRKPPNNEIENFYIKNTPKNRIAGPVLQAGMDQLYKEISDVRPKIIIALGDTALWALTGNRGITKWRGSQLSYSIEGNGGATAIIIPTYHPAAILRVWSWRAISILDLKRAQRALSSNPQLPKWSFHIRPRFTFVLHFLDEIRQSLNRQLTWIGGDLETRSGHIACFGITTDENYLEALCIPFMCVEKPEGYFTEEEEIEIVYQLTRLFRHPNSRWIFQNGLYDYQYFARHWGCVPRLGLDTMLSHHTLWAGMPKGLDFLSSMYCGFHRYWKQEGKDWDPSVPEEQLWEYNCKDCVSMMEVAVNLKAVAKQLNLTSPVSFQHQQFPAVLDMMLRGVRTNQTSRNELSKELQSYKDKLNSWFTFVLNQEINVDSPKQMMELFYEDLQQKVIRRKRKAGKFTPTMDDDALTLLGQRQPLLLPILKNIARLRSVGKFKSTFVDMQADPIDGRMRTSYGIAGTDTFRYNSAKDAFGSGGNLQNIPTGEEEEAAAKTEFPLPNIRKLFIPDEGFTIAEWDLRRADTQVVAWEADDVVLKQMLKEGVNLHNENAKEIFGRYPKNDYDPIYKQAKVGVHAVDYGVMAPTLARELGITLHEADRFIRRWFEVHPGIKNWHERVWKSLETTRSVTNKFGYRRYYFDRIDSIFPKALAWVPQSTVALVIDKGIVNVFEQLPKVQNLLQVHDSLVNQFPTKDKAFWIREIQPRMLIEIPYEDPLIIPIGVKTSEVSWGDCEEYELK